MIKYRGREGETVPAGKRLKGFEDQGEELLPGIPKDITLDLIAPQLSWKDLLILRAVTPGWQQAIQSGEVYDARVRSRSTETLVVVNRNSNWAKDNCAIALYSMNDNIFYELPQIPGLRGVYKSQCVSRDGKIYVMGGSKVNFDSDCAEVYMLDLSRQRLWKQCASMQEPRLNFGSGVIDGKIYVFGGTSRGKLLCGSEVYDPKINVWSRIKPMTVARFGHQVLTVGKVLLVCGGSSRDVDGELRILMNLESLEVYDPVKDDWTSIKVSPEPSWCLDEVFIAHGRIHVLTEDGVFVHDIDKCSWTPLQIQSHADRSRQCTLLWPHSILAVNGELLATGWYQDRGRADRLGLLQSEGFGEKNKKITWRVAKSYPSLRDLFSDFGRQPLLIYTVRL